MNPYNEEVYKQLAQLPLEQQQEFAVWCINELNESIFKGYKNTESYKEIKDLIALLNDDYPSLEETFEHYREGTKIYESYVSTVRNFLPLRTCSVAHPYHPCRLMIETHLKHPKNCCRTLQDYLAYGGSVIKAQLKMRYL